MNCVEDLYKTISKINRLVILKPVIIKSLSIPMQKRIVEIMSVV